METKMDSGVITYITSGHIVSSLGLTTEENMENIRRQKTGISLHSCKDISSNPFMGGLIDPALPKLPDSGYTRLEQLFIYTIQQVINKTGINPAECGLIFSTTKGNIDLLEQESDDIYLSRMGKKIAQYFNIPESPIVISTACISGVSALIVASRLIKSGTYKHILVAGGDLLTRFVLSGFQSFKSISRDICRPYDKDRDGLTLGEACGCLLMTTSRVYVQESTPVIFEGGTITNDANHISGPSRTGDGLYQAITRTMEQAGIENHNISFINTHGTGTLYNDEMESKAIRWCKLDNKPLNSLKSYWGHTLGASGIVETIACMEQLQTGKIAGTYGYRQNGVCYHLCVNEQEQTFTGGRCIKTASGFGGCNAAISLALEPYIKTVPPKEEITIQNKAGCLIRDNKIIVNGKPFFEYTENAPFPDFIRAAYKHLKIEDRKFYKMDDLCKLGYIAAHIILDNISREHIPSQQAGIILSNASSSLDSDKKHQSVIDNQGEEEASPAIFVYTLPNVVMGEICIRHKIQGENTFFITEKYDKDFIRDYTRLAMQEQDMGGCISGWCELLDNKYEACFEWWEKE